MEELKQEAQKALEIVEKIDNELTKRLNENPMEKLREFLGV